MYAVKSACKDVAKWLLYMIQLVNDESMWSFSQNTSCAVPQNESDRSEGGFISFRYGEGGNCFAKCI